jgi:hypothetical protein
MTMHLVFSCNEHKKQVTPVSQRYTYSTQTQIDKLSALRRVPAALTQEKTEFDETNSRLSIPVGNVRARSAYLVLKQARCGR